MGELFSDIKVGFNVGINYDFNFIDFLRSLATARNLTILLGVILIIVLSIAISRRKEVANISKIKMIILSALFISLNIVLTRFLSVQTPVIRLGFGAIPIFLSGMILGVKHTVLIAIISNLLGATVFATSGMPFFPGFTLNAALIGLMAGVLLYETKEKQYSDMKFFLVLICLQTIIMGVITMLMTPIWLTAMLGQELAWHVFWARVILNLGVVAIEVPLILVIRKAIRPLLNKYIYEEG
ncbi:MAG: folate family ECF transporter S component [Oscillospiraceae bacterium]|nr:folate family ECF transporter S component [Oscillospiraceae bacterium]